MEWIQVPFESRLVVDLVLGAVLLEAIALVAILKWSGTRTHAAEFLIPLASGAVLLLALRSAIGGASAAWLALLLAMAGAIHYFDLRARWRTREPRIKQPTEQSIKQRTSIGH